MKKTMLALTGFAVVAGLALALGVQSTQDASALVVKYKVFFIAEDDNHCPNPEIEAEKAGVVFAKEKFSSWNLGIPAFQEFTTLNQRVGGMKAASFNTARVHRAAMAFPGDQDAAAAGLMGLVKIASDAVKPGTHMDVDCTIPIEVPDCSASNNDDGVKHCKNNTENTAECSYWARPIGLTDGEGWTDDSQKATLTSTLCVYTVTVDE